MASTYVNDLRLNEMATGDASGTWGTVTNTNLELIGEALGYGTEGITTNANTHTTTVADGATDPGRAMYIEYTGTLDSACTITIAPNTLNRMHFIENGTSGSQNIIIKQGSGATITIPPGDTKAVYLDGAGSGAAVVDAFASLSVVDLKVQDDLTVTDDLIVGGDIDLEGAIDVNGTANLDVVDIDGAVDMASTLQVDGAITSSAGATITTADNLDTLSLVSTDADANVAPNLRMYRNSGSPADSDQLGKIQIEGRNDNSQDVIYGEIGSQIVDASDGTEDGRVFINTMVAGSLQSRMNILATEVVFNEESNDQDFRVESDGNANMLFVDGGNNTVGINDSTPAALFTVKASANTYAGGFRIEGTDETTALGITHVNGDNFFSGNATDDHLVLTSDGKLGIGTASPGSALHVDKSFSGTLVTFHQTAGSSSADRGLDVETSSTGTTVQRWINSGTTLAQISGSGILSVGTSLGTDAVLNVIRSSGEVFRADANNGAFRLVADQGQVFANVMRVTPGALSAPSYAFVGETNTGISRPTSSAINFVTGGSENARFHDGSLLIGTESLDGNAQKLHVFQNANNKFTGIFACGGNNVNRFGPAIRCGTDDNSGTNTMLTFQDGNGDGIGTITSSGGTVSYGAFTAHHEVNVPDADNPSDDTNAYPYGTLVEVVSTYLSDTNKQGSIRYTVQKSQSANSKKVLGAYCSNMGPNPMVPTSGTYANNLHMISILGDGHIICNNSGGNIEIGDGICTSSTAGIGMKATDNPSMIVGIAQEDVTFSGSGTKLVAVQFGVQQFTPWS